jgi:hypothetical protein
MGKSADESGVDKQVIELVKLRVSQINNCAFRLPLRAADPQAGRRRGLASPSTVILA